MYAFINTHINVLVAAEEVLGHMARKNVGQQFPVVGLQVLHVFLFLVGLQFPDKVQPISGLRLVAVENQCNHEDHNEHGILGCRQESAVAAGNK